MFDWLKPIILVDADILRLPAFTAESLWYLVYFLLFIILFLAFLAWRLRKQTQRNALKNSFMLMLMRRGLTKLQLAAMQDFFRSLSEVDQQEILLSNQLMAQHLQQYLTAHRNLTGNDRVEIFDKVLPKSIPQIEIKSLADLRSGELAAIDIGHQSCLATIMKIKDNQILLSSADKLPAAPVKAQIYTYRPGLGGYLLAGEIIKSQAQSHIFRHDGPIEFRGDQHLMTVTPVTLKLEPWPHPDIDGGGKQATETEQGLDSFSGTTEKLSDRALVIRFAAAPPDWVLKKQDLWELTLEIDEHPVVCRVRIASYKAGQTWMLRPVDMSSAERNRLYKFIAAHEPVREHF